MKMTPNTQKQGGKYNADKEWKDENTNKEAFVSADDSMAYVSKKKYAIMDKMEDKQEPEEKVEATSQEATPEPELKEEKPDRFKKVDYKKRYDDLKRHYDTKVNAWKEQEKELKRQAREAAPKYQPPTSEDELAKFKEDNPDLFNVVETVSHMRASQEMKDLQEQLKDVTERLQYEEANRAYIELKSLVPDYEDIRQSDDFHAWAESQPQEIQDWVYNNRTNVQLAARAINLYKADRGTVQTPPAENTQSDNRGTADQSVGVRSHTEEPQSREKIWTNQEIKDLSIEQYEQLRDEIDQAFADGRVVME